MRTGMNRAILNLAFIPGVFLVGLRDAAFVRTLYLHLARSARFDPGSACLGKRRESGGIWLGGILDRSGKPAVVFRRAFVHARLRIPHGGQLAPRESCASDEGAAGLFRHARIGRASSYHRWVRGSH